MKASFQAFVVQVLFDRSGAVFALADGTVRFESGETIAAHDGAVLSMALHPAGDGVITGGDDGRLVWSRRAGAEELAHLGGKWLDAVATSPDSGLIAVAAGRELIVRDSKDASFERRFRHERAVTDVAFEPKGRRIVAATYNGVMLWYARIPDQKPTLLKWPGAHTGVVVSPDGRFILSSMQENALHGWRVSDGKDMRMAGYPGKIRSMAFMAKGALLATSGAPGVVIWPFSGSNGPMGREAVEIGVDESAMVVRCAGARDTVRLAAGLSDGRVWSVDLNQTGQSVLKAEKGAPISAMAVSHDGSRIAFGDEDGEAAVVDAPQSA